MATIYEVSNLAGVSLATVSRVINNKTPVSEKTRKKVESAMQELGYRPNAIAQSLASNRTNSVGILVSELHGPFFGQMMAGIEAELRSAGKHVIITTGHSEEEREKDGIEFLISRNCDALIVHVESVDDDYLKQLSKGDTPIYFMSRIVEDLESKCIYLDNELGGYLAAKAVIDLGHEHIAYISGPQFKADSKDRLRGHKRALDEHGLTFNEALYFEGEYKENCGIEGVKQLLGLGLEFTAIVCGNDEIALGALTYAREFGMVVPRDISIIGFDNTILSSYIYPKLTTIDNPVNKMGHMAAKLVLKDVYQHSNLDIDHSFVPSLILRESIS
ncbi:LacI family DNA-binding transcriptional regulator [Glaciecola sp. 2405UD65-10]|uniref:LacI family DNA-binding transcriptional regulator n=1 Tax=Glaciecola sp. 2405UD65-10 TaxID=3397244 RepID=UPI003B59118A